MVMTLMAVPPKLGMAIGIMTSLPLPVEVRMEAAEGAGVSPIILVSSERAHTELGGITEASHTSQSIRLFRALNLRL